MLSTNVAARLRIPRNCHDDQGVRDVRLRRELSAGSVIFLYSASMVSPAILPAQMPPPVVSAAQARRLAQPLGDQHGVVTSADGTCLFYRYWPATEAWNGHIALVLHGIGYHSGPYKVVADALNPRGLDVYGLDARAHGLSCGRRGYIGTPDQVGADIAAMVRFLKQNRRGAKIFLVNDSMGCNYALDYAKDHGDELAGLILLAPAFDVDKRQLFQLNSLMLLPDFLFAHRRPVINLVGHRLDESSRDPNFIASRRTDPLAYSKVSFGYLLEIKHLVRRWKRDIAPKIQMPLLVIQGGKDNVVSHKDCVKFERLAGSSDKQLKIFPGVYHTTLWDPETPKILRTVGDWILAR
jgi:alpha-beta hydrolase superfamily lysophospholipase